jgi:membrane protein YqaA with SNARE-associated domain
MLRRLYDRVLTLAASPRAELWLAAIAFAESSFFPIPPDTLLVPMALAKPQRAWRYAAICTGASVAGGLLGYAIGALLYEDVARPLLDFYHYSAQFEVFRQRFAENGVAIILIKGVLPIPFKIITIAAGVAAMNLPAFVAACVVTRGARFFLEAALLCRFGEPVREFIENRLMLVTSAAAAAVVGGFLLLRYI